MGMIYVKQERDGPYIKLSVTLNGTLLDILKLLPEEVKPFADQLNQIALDLEVTNESPA